jgi:hypothetical protein
MALVAGTRSELAVPTVCTFITGTGLIVASVPTVLIAPTVATDWAGYATVPTGAPYETVPTAAADIDMMPYFRFCSKLRKQAGVKGVDLCKA